MVQFSSGGLGLNDFICSSNELSKGISYVMYLNSYGAYRLSNLCRTLDHEEENVLVSNLVLTQLCSHETAPRESTYTRTHLCRLWWDQAAFSCFNNFIARYMNPLLHCSRTIKIRPVLLQLVDTDKNLIPGLYCASATISTISPPCSWSWQGTKVCKTS